MLNLNVNPLSHRLIIIFVLFSAFAMLLVPMSIVPIAMAGTRTPAAELKPSAELKLSGELKSTAELNSSVAPKSAAFKSEALKAKTPAKTIVTPTPSGTRAATQLSALLNDMQTYQAQFKQTVYDQNGQVIQRASGRMSLKRPGRFRWETAQPFKQLVLANRNQLWVYDPELQQATHRVLTLQPNNPASILISQKPQLLRQFDIQSLGQQRFVLRPKGKNQVVQRILLQFNGKQLIAMTLINQNNQKNQIEFSQIKINASLSDRYFEFHPPKGTQILQQSSPMKE